MTNLISNISNLADQFRGVLLDQRLTNELSLSVAEAFK